MSRERGQFLKNKTRMNTVPEDDASKCKTFDGAQLRTEMKYDQEVIEAMEIMEQLGCKVLFGGTIGSPSLLDHPSELHHKMKSNQEAIEAMEQLGCEVLFGGTIGSPWLLDNPSEMKL